MQGRVIGVKNKMEKNNQSQVAWGLPLIIMHT